MTFHFGKRIDSPVFDFPTKPSPKKDNIIKRFLTRTSRPIFAPKHEPITASYKNRSSKCFALSSNRLFHFNNKLSLPLRTKPNNELKNDHHKLLFFQRKEVCHTRNRILLTDRLDTKTGSLEINNYNIPFSLNTLKKTRVINYYLSIEQNFACLLPKMSFQILGCKHKLSIKANEFFCQKIRRQFEINFAIVFNSRLKNVFEEIFIRKAIFHFHFLNKSSESSILRNLSNNFLLYKDKLFYKLKPTAKYLLYKNYINHTLDADVELKHEFHELQTKADIGKNLAIYFWQEIPISLGAFSALSFTNDFKNVRTNIFKRRDNLSLKFPNTVLENSFKNKTDNIINCISNKLVQFKLSEKQNKAINSVNKCFYRKSFKTKSSLNRGLNSIKLKLHLNKTSNANTVFSLMSNFSSLQPHSNSNIPIPAIKINQFIQLNKRHRERIDYKSRIRFFKGAFCKKRISGKIQHKFHNQNISYLFSVKESLCGLNNKKEASFSSVTFNRNLAECKFECRFPVMKLLDVFTGFSRSEIFSHLLRQETACNDIIHANSEINKQTGKKFNPTMLLSTLRRRTLPLNAYQWNADSLTCSFIKLNQNVSKKLSILKKLNIARFNLLVKTIKNDCSFIQNYVKKNRTFIVNDQIVHKSLNYSAYIPESITDSLFLKMEPARLSNLKSLTKLEIIQPPPWNFMVRHFNCSVNLSPFPFGFPTLILKKFIPKLLSSKITFSPVLSPTYKLEIVTLYFTRRQKSFRSPINLKDPKKWLLPDNHIMEGKIESSNFNSLNEGMYDTLIRQHNVDKFLFSWEKQNDNKILVSDFRQNFIKSTTDTKVFENTDKKVTTPSMNSGVCKKETPLLLSVNIINRFILSHISIKSLRNFGKTEFLNKTSKQSKNVFSILATSKSMVPYFYRPIEFKTIQKNILAFAQNIKHEYPSEPRFKVSFKARYRQFFFPWHPEHGILSMNKVESFFKLGDTPISIDNTISEDTAFTQIPYVCNAPNENILEYNSDNSVYYDPPGFKFLLKPVRLVFQNKQFTASKVERLPATHLSTIKIVSNKVLRFKAKPQCLYKQDTLKCSFNYLSYQKPVNHKLIQRRHVIPNKFIMDSVHWVILLSNFIRIGTLLEKFNSYISKRQAQFKCNDILMYKVKLQDPNLNLNIQTGPKPSYSYRDQSEIHYTLTKLDNWVGINVIQKQFSFSHSIKFCNSNFSEIDCRMKISKPKQTSFSPNKYNWNETFPSFEFNLISKLQNSLSYIETPSLAIPITRLKATYIPDWIDMNEIIFKKNLKISSSIDLEP